MEIENRIDCENSEQIETTIKQNSLKRNIHLNNIMKIFNSIPSSITLSIDGNWGSGKTVFAKQLQFLADLKISEDSKPDLSEIDLLELENFQKAFDIYYFNSWEYDMYEKPLEIFLKDLIKHRLNTMIRQDKNVDYLEKAIQKVLIPITKTGTKVMSGGTIDLEELFGGETKDEKLLRTTSEVDELKKRIFEILKVLTEKKDIIIIIDELDRCKPTFAVELLETLKHYFSYGGPSCNRTKNDHRKTNELIL